MTTSTTVSVSPEVLSWARRRSAASLADAAAKAHRSEDELAAWESGDPKPDLAALRELAAYYGVPLSVFLLDHAPPVSPRPVDLRTFAGVVRPGLSLDLAKALNRAAALQEVAGDLQGELGQPPYSPPSVTTVDPEALAAQLRPALGVSTDEQRRLRNEWSALRTWRSAIERLGIFVLQLPMPKAEVRAFSLSQRPPFIILNQSDFVRARIFSLMHEYGHVVLGAGGICLPGAGRRSMEEGVSVEVFCNRFAGAVLVPPEPLRADPLAKQVAATERVPDDETLERLAGHFGVSWAVVWYRLHHLGLVSSAVFKAKWEDWDRFPARPSGGGGMTTQERVLAQYGTSLTGLVLRAAERQAITEAAVAQYLDFGASHVGDLEAVVASRTPG